MLIRLGRAHATSEDAEQHATPDSHRDHGERMIPVVGAPVGQRPRLVLEQLEVAPKLVALGRNIPFYLACAFAHWMFSCTVVTVRGGGSETSFSCLAPTT